MPKKVHKSSKSTTEGSVPPTKKRLAFKDDCKAIRRLAAKLKPDEGYDSAEWTKIAERGRWGGSVVGKNYKRWSRDLRFRSACEIAYCREQPPLIEIVKTIFAALEPCETHVRDRMLRLAREYPTDGKLLSGFIETPREAAIALLVRGTADSNQPYGLRRGELEIALRHQWPGITSEDIDAAIEEGLRLRMMTRRQVKLRDWDRSEAVFRTTQHVDTRPKSPMQAELEVPEASLVHVGFTPGQLAEQLEISNQTLRMSAKCANVLRPGRGQKNFRYPLDAALKIAAHIISTGGPNLARTAKRWLELNNKSKR